MTGSYSEKGLAAIERVKAKKAQNEVKIQPVGPKFAPVDAEIYAEFADLVPNLDANLPASAPPTVEQDYEAQLDRFIEGLSFIEAYNKFVGGKVKWSGADENNMIQCPRPDHIDEKPSAWFNISKKFWDCGGVCNDGGSIIDLVGATMGIKSTHERKNKNFHDIRRRIAREYGWYVGTAPDGKAYVVPPGHKVEKKPSRFFAPPSRPVQAEQTSESEEAQEQPKLHIVPDISPESSDDDSADEITFPTLNWREIFTEDTFIKAFMETTCEDDVPEMYHMAHALLGLGLLIGRKVFIKENDPVFGNLFVCLLGKSGEGKSRSRKYLADLIHEVLPYDAVQERPTGVKFVRAPVSAPAIVRSFRHEKKLIVGNVTHTGEIGWNKGLVEYSELFGLTKTVMQPNNAQMQSTFFDLYDGDRKIGATTKGDEQAEYTASYAFGSVLTTTQPGMLHKILSIDDAVSGFVNRWSFFGSTPKKKIAIHLTPTDLTYPIQKFREISEWVHDPTQPYEQLKVEWTPEAFKYYTERFHTDIEPLKQKDQSSVAQRSDLFMKKLALLLTVNAMETKITQSIIEQAFKFWDYTVAMYQILDNTIGRPVVQQRDEKILHFVRTAKGRGKAWKPGDGVPISVIRKYCSASPLTKGITDFELSRCLETLRKLGYIDWQLPDGSDSRKTVLYKAVSE